MFTGRYVHETTADWLIPLDDKWATLAEVLGSAGYLTVGISGSTDYASREVGLGRGFAHFEDYPLSLLHIIRSTPMTRMVARNKTLRRILGLEHSLGRRHAPVITSRLVRWLDQHSEQPYFAFLNYYDAHRPYWPPKEYRDRFVPEGEPEWYPASQGDLAAIVNGPWRYIRNLETGVEELYNYRLDAVEARDLAGDTAATAAVKELRTALVSGRGSQ